MLTSLATALVAYAPWVAPKTREPTGNLGFLELAGVASTTPANSAPETQGKAARVSSWVIGRMFCGELLTRLVLIFALDLQDVKEVCRRGMNLDEILVRGRLGVGKLRYLQLVGSLLVSVVHVVANGERICSP